MENRPKWECLISIEHFGKLLYPVKQITHHWQMTGVDTSENWLVFKTDKESFRAPEYWDRYFSFKPYYGGLLELNWLGRQQLVIFNDIHAWDAINIAEREQYEILKKKFGDI
jgi:hypothetical protein